MLAPRLSTSSKHEAAASHPWRRFRATLIRFDSTKADTARGLRNALGVAIPLAFGAMAGRVGPALVVAIGALNVGFADSPEPYLARVRRLLGACLLVTLAVFCGSFFSWSDAGALATAALWTFCTGMLVSLGVAAGNMGVTSTSVLLVFASRPLPAGQAALCGLLALGGGLLQTLLSICFWPVRPFEPEQLALASLYLGIARLSERSVHPAGSPAATVKTSDAAEALAARQGDHSEGSERLRALLDQGERIRVCLLTLRALRERADGGDHALSSLLDDYFGAARKVLEAVAEMLRTGRSWEAEPRPVDAADCILEAVRNLPPGGAQPALVSDIRAQMDALARQLRIVFDLASNATPSGSFALARGEASRPWRLRALSTLRANLNLHSTAFRHALRLAVCVTAADALGRALGWYRPYWLPLTVNVVLKPDFSSTFSRGVLRLAGTFAGLGLATALFHLLPRTLPVEIGLIMAATFVVRWIGPAQYGVLAMGVSELVVLLVALAGVQPGQAVMARARNTALGGALALLAYWLWPTWERSQIAETFATMLEAYRQSFELLARAFSQETPELSAALDRARSASRLARTNLEASVDRLSAEPGTSPGERDRWHAMLASSHIFANAMIMLHASLLAAPDSLRPLGRNQAFQDFARDAALTLERLAAILRGAGAKPAAFPDLREAHYRLVHSGEAMAGRDTLIRVETDKMVNSLNTLREQILGRDGGAGKGTEGTETAEGSRAFEARPCQGG